MILVDTCVWVDHLRKGDAQLVQALNANKVLMHPWVAGELALGHLKNRDALLSALQGLPQALVASDQEIRALIETHALQGMGLGYVDVGLLAATRLTAHTTFWTRDQRLQAAAQQLGIAETLRH